MKEVFGPAPTLASEQTNIDSSDSQAERFGRPTPREYQQLLNRFAAINDACRQAEERKRTARH